MAELETLQLFRGYDLLKYKDLGLGYVGSLFFDLSDNKIYLGTNQTNIYGYEEFTPVAMDSLLQVSRTFDMTTGLSSTILSFSANDSETISISETNIPSLDEEDSLGRLDLSLSKSGFFSVLDKYILDKIAQALGVKVEVEDGLAKFSMNPVGIGGDSSVSLYFDGGDTADDTRVLVKHGNIKAGTTIADLELMTYSDILKSMIFETAEPECIQEIVFDVSWKSPWDDAIDVGDSFPYNDMIDGSTFFSYKFLPEVWNWTASDGVTKGEEKTLNKEDHVNYYWIGVDSSTILTYNSPQRIDVIKLPEGWKKTIEGENGYFFAGMTYTKLEDAIDSMNEKKDWYGKASDGVIYTRDNMKYVGAWRVYANANLTYKNAQNAFTFKDVEGAYQGLDTKSPFLFIKDAGNVILLWPKKADLLPTEKLFVYIPYNNTKYKITNVVNIADTIATFSGAILSFLYIEDVSIDNGFKIGNFSKYEISPNAGVTTCLITIAKGEHE